MIKSTTATSQAGRHENRGGSPNRFLPPRGGTLPEATESLDLHIARIEEWGRRFGRDFDHVGTHKFAIEMLRVVADRLHGRVDDASPPFRQDDRPARDQPLLKLGQGAYTREVRGDPRTGALNVQG